MKRLCIVGLLVACAAIFTGCGGARFPKYYALSVPPPPDPPAVASQSSIAVREFQSPVYLRQGPIVYRRFPEEIGFYEYHRWAEDPRKTVTSTVLDYLRASGQFSTVSAYDGRTNTEYVLSGKLQKLEEIDYDGGVKVEVAVYAQITKASTGAMVWSNSFSELGKVSERSVPGIVAQMNQTMEQAIKRLLSTVPTQLAATSNVVGSVSPSIPQQ